MRHNQLPPTASHLFWHWHTAQCYANSLLVKFLRTFCNDCPLIRPVRAFLFRHKTRIP